MRAAKQRVAATKGKSLKQARQALEINNLEAILTAVFNKGRVVMTLTKNAKWVKQGRREANSASKYPVIAH